MKICPSGPPGAWRTEERRDKDERAKVIAKRSSKQGYALISARAVYSGNDDYDSEGVILPLVQLEARGFFTCSNRSAEGEQKNKK